MNKQNNKQQTGTDNSMHACTHIMEKEREKKEEEKQNEHRTEGTFASS